MGEKSKNQGPAYCIHEHMADAKNIDDLLNYDEEGETNDK